MKKWQKYTIIGAAAAVALGLVIWGCITLWMKPAEPIITAPTETTEPVLATVPDATAPVETEPVEATVPVTEPEVTHGEETQPEETEPATVPEETVPETTHGEEVTEPVVTTPKETTPKETTPKETQPKPTEPPKETQPKPTDPKPTEPPKETQPKPTDPKPTEPPKTHTHSYKAKVVEPTCEEKGYTVHTCSCGDSYTDSEVDALGHDMYEEVIEPGVGYRGYTYHWCYRCGLQYEDNFVDALPEPTTAEIQQAIIKYINQYRAEQGSTQLTYLPGMTNVAKYRSKQLTTNFAHDEHDKREALAYYQYGEYIDMTEMGFDESYNYYDAKTREAIAYATYGGSADEIGQSFARGFQKSSGHWSYVGSSENSYIGVGVTKSGGLWYVCVMVGSVNYG